MLNEDLRQYIEKNIIPQYRCLDPGHNESHIRFVIDKSVRLGDKYGGDTNMVFTIAAYHDLGMLEGRCNHAVNSGKKLMQDEYLSRWFNMHQLLIMKQAIEEHSSSKKTEPKTLYGKIIYQADRNLDIQMIVYRAMMYGLAFYPNYTLEEQSKRVYDYLLKKYGEAGDLILWLDEASDREKLAQIRKYIQEKKTIYKLCKVTYDKWEHTKKNEDMERNDPTKRFFKKVQHTGKGVPVIRS